MRIEAYNAVSQEYQASTQVKNVNSNKKVGRDDKLEISQTGKDINVAKKAMQNAPEVREDRVAAIKKQMEEGTYAVSMEDVANKIKSLF